MQREKGEGNEAKERKGEETKERQKETIKKQNRNGCFQEENKRTK